MKVYLYIFKVQTAYANETETRYIVRVHRFGTPNSKWLAADSLVEVHYALYGVFPAFNWGEIEKALEAEGGYDADFDIGEFEYAKLFST